MKHNLPLYAPSVFSTSRLYTKTRKSGPCFFDAPVGIPPSLVYIEAMSSLSSTDLEQFHFRHLHPQVKVGTASDRYAGWIGQIYSAERYRNRLKHRTKVIGEQTFTETVLPVDSVVEYFEHFLVLEIDFTFYRSLLDQHGKSTQAFQTLKAYKRHFGEGDALLLKVPQVATAPRLRRGGQYRDNPAYLDAKIFTRQFYQPALELLGPVLTGFIFEQEYLTKQDRPPVTEMAEALDGFFQEIPKDSRYHLELRTDLYLRDPIFEILEKHGVGQVLSHWTWLPPLRKQLAKAGNKFFNAGKQCLIRLLTPLGMRYDESYVQAFPFRQAGGGHAAAGDDHGDRGHYVTGYESGSYGQRHHQ
jgi:uncharacterized protein YecE (DUF72 family)